MRSAIYCANFGRLADVTVLADLAQRAEAAGWDGFFVYDHVMIVRDRAVPSVDPWTVLAVIADRTALWLGPMVTPLARRQPWEVAHQCAALAGLSGGRVVLGAGLGESMDHEAFGMPADPRVLAARLDESLDLVPRLWAGETVDHVGTWTLDGVRMSPVGQRIPIWIAGRRGARRPLARALRHDGFFPINHTWDLGAMLSAGELGAIAAAVRDRRGSLDGFDLATAGVTSSGAGGPASVAAHREAGATWWLEVIEPRRGHLDELQARVAAGPPPA